MTGLITGIAAALSMGASEYLSTKSEPSTKNPARASLYTGVAYVVTVLLLILPYLVFQDYYVCLGLTLAWVLTSNRRQQSLGDDATEGWLLTTETARFAAQGMRQTLLGLSGFAFAWLKGV